MTDTLDRLILQIVQKNDVREQKELQDLLEGLGHVIPQSTLSRRLNKLCIAKVNQVYRLVNSNKIRMIDLLSTHIVPPNLIFIRTLPGHAQSFSYYLDGQLQNDFDKAWEGILGTVAGDDSLLIIISEPRYLDPVFNKIQTMYDLKNEKNL